MKKNNLNNSKKIATMKFIIISDWTRKKSIQKKKVITKILKLDENNHYGFGMTKPLSTGCVKQNFDASLRTFNLFLQNVSLDDQIGHLYVVDIEFDHINKKYIYWFMGKVSISVAWTIFFNRKKKSTII